MCGPGRWRFNWCVPCLMRQRTSGDPWVNAPCDSQSISAVGSVIAMLLTGPIAFSISGLAMFILVLPMAFILDFLGALLVGLCAFWLESTQGIALIYSRLMMLLGGLLPAA